MSCYIRLFHSLVMWSEPLLSVMTEENPKDMVLLSFQERTLRKLLCSKLMMAYSSLEGNSKIMMLFIALQVLVKEFPSMNQ